MKEEAKSTCGQGKDQAFQWMKSHCGLTLIYVLVPTLCVPSVFTGSRFERKKLRFRSSAAENWFLEQIFGYNIGGETARY